MRMQVPMDYPAAVMVLCLAGAVNRRARIQPKANDSGWLIVPNLWGGIIAPPVPAFYSRPRTLDDMIAHTVGRTLDLFDLDTKAFPRWGETGVAQETLTYTDDES